MTIDRRRDLLRSGRVPDRFQDLKMTTIAVNPFRGEGGGGGLAMTAKVTTATEATAGMMVDRCRELRTLCLSRVRDGGPDGGPNFKMATAAVAPFWGKAGGGGSATTAEVTASLTVDRRREIWTTRFFPV